MPVLVFIHGIPARACTWIHAQSGLESSVGGKKSEGERGREEA